METRYELLKGLQEIKMGDGNHQINGFGYKNWDFDDSDCIVVDLECLSNGLNIEPNSRITKNFYRKIPQLDIDKKIKDRDSLAPSSSHRGTQVTSMPEKSLPLPTSPMGSLDSPVNYHLPQHQITIKTSGLTTVPEGRWGRRSCFKRYSVSWFRDPKRILLFFATLSSMGTMLLIFFTLLMSKHNEKVGTLDWQ